MQGLRQDAVHLGQRPIAPVKEHRLLTPGVQVALQAYAFLLPIIAVVVLSFFNWGLLALPTFIGLQNYSRLLSSASFWQSLFVTFYYVLLNIPMQTVLALLLAVLLNQKLPGRGIFRTLFVVPWMATPVAMGIVWQWIFDPQYGALNAFLSVFHIPGPAWLSSPAWAMLAPYCQR